MTADIEGRQSSSNLSVRFAALISGEGAEKDAAPAGLIGLEHEFVVRRDGEAIDFRQLVGRMNIDGQRLDPGDVNAYRCRWGGVITADGAEAEIATPPLEVRPGFVTRLDRQARMAAHSLYVSMPRGYALEGYSTHLSVAMPSQLGPRAADAFVRYFSPGLMLLTDRHDSPGLLVRPRSGRLEAAFEYVSGNPLRAATAYFAGAARAIARWLTGGAGDSGDEAFAPEVRAEYVPTADRVGWGMRRTAFGPDLLSTGRSGRLMTTSGSAISAHDHLARAWASARSALSGVATRSDIAAAERLVRGQRQLPVEVPDAGPARILISRRRLAVGEEMSPYGALLDERRRSAVTVAARIATWDLTVFEILGRLRSAFAAVPRSGLARFLDLLDAGHLDELLSSYVQQPPSGRRLDGWANAQSPGLYDELGVSTSFIAPEATYAPASTTSIAVVGERAGKPVEVPGRVEDGNRRLLIGGLIGLIIGTLLGGLIVGYVLGGGIQPTPPPSVATARPSVAPTPTPTLGIVVTPPPTATPLVVVTPPPTPVIVVPPTPANVIESVCVRVVHESLGEYISYLDWALIWSGAVVDYFELIVSAAKDGEPVRLTYDPTTETWRSQLGLRGTGDKQITSLIAHLSDGAEIDLTEDLIDALGDDTVTVRFPQEDAYGECA